MEALWGKEVMGQYSSLPSGLYLRLPVIVSHIPTDFRLQERIKRHIFIKKALCLFIPSLWFSLFIIDIQHILKGPILV